MRKDIKLISISGIKQSGKDTIADLLEKEYGYVRYSFATPVKEALKHLFKFDDEQLYGDKKEIIDQRWGLSPRDAMTIIATELLQIDIHNYFPKNKLKFTDNLFVKLFEYWIEENPHIDKIVIPDLRLPQEYEFLKENNCKFILIKRVNQQEIKHKSEKEFNKFDFDYVIDNNETIENLYIKCHEIFKNI